MASEIRVDKINSLSGVGTVTLSPTGVDIAGITTVATFKVGTGVTASSDGNIFATGVTTSTSVNINGGNITLGDSGGATDDRIAVGAGGDIHIYHDGTNSYVSNATGDLNLFSVGGSADDVIIRAQDDIELQPNNGSSGIKVIGAGGVEIYHNNVKMLETTSIGMTISGDVKIIDNENLRLGTDNDLLLYHTGSNAFIENSTGDFYIRGVDEKWLYIQAKSGENSIICKDDAAVELYHDNTKQCETSANGLAFPSGKGIDFSATGGPTNGSGSSELLDDYEEGTWTPTMNNSITLSTANGRYIKTGHTVQAWFRITFPSTSSNGHVIMQNLPFANTSAVPATGGVARGYQTYDIENGPIYHIGSNSSSLEFYKNAGQNLAASNASTYQFRGCIIYQTA